MKKRSNWKIASTILSFSGLLLVFSSCGSKFKSAYSGQVSDKNGVPMKEVTIYAISIGKADSNLIHALTPEEIALFKGEKALSSSFGDKTDSSGKFSVSTELENTSPAPNMHLLFRKSGYKSILINMESGMHNNVEVKLDSAGVN